MTETITFKNTDEAVRYALAQISQLNTVCVELRGQIEAHRYAAHALAICLSETEALPSDVLAMAFEKAADIAQEATAPFTDPTSKLQFGEVTKELRKLAEQIRQPGPPTFSVIDGGRSD